jgi:hypothetical protein
MKRNEPHWLDKVTNIFLAKTGDWDDLARIAGGDPRTFYIGTRLPGSHPSNDIDKRVSDVEILKDRIKASLISISKYKHQADRVSMIMLLAYQNPNFLVDIAVNTIERTKVGNEMLIIFFERFKADLLFKGYVDPHVFAKSVESSLKIVYNLNKGTFIFYFSRNLGGIIEVSDLIRNRFLKNTWAFRHYHGSINDELVKWESRRKRINPTLIDQLLANKPVGNQSAGEQTTMW